MASSGPTESSAPQVWPNPPQSQSGIEQNLDQWVHDYFTELEPDASQSCQYFEDGPKAGVESAPPDPVTSGVPAVTQTILDTRLPREEDEQKAASLDESVAVEIADSEDREAANPAISGLLLEHAQKFFSSTAETELLAAGNPVPETPQIPASILIPPADPIAAPGDAVGGNWARAVCEFPRACGSGIRCAIRRLLRIPLAMFALGHKLLLACGRSIVYAGRAILRVPLAMFAAVRKLLLACGKGILYAGRAILRVPLAMFAAARKLFLACGKGIVYAGRASLRVPLAMFAAARKLLLACGRRIVYAGRAILRVLLAVAAAVGKLLAASLNSIHRAARSLAGIADIAFATMRESASACGRGFRRVARDATRALGAMFVTSRHLPPAFGKRVRWGIRTLANLPFPTSFPRFRPVGTQARRAVVPVSVLIIVFTFLVSMLRTVTRGASNPRTSMSSNRVADGTAGKAVALPTHTEEGSHGRVTDPAIYDKLANLSTFEIGPLKRQATYGDEDAAFLLAMAYETGYGLSQSCAKASRWVRVSAEAGNAAAEYNLGLRYLHGDGVALNRAEGLKWLEKSAAQDYPGANTLLASSKTY